MYERITIRHPHPYEDFITINETKQLPDTEQSRKVLNRLCDLEDKICEGRMVELPCAVGDTLWKIEDVWHLDDRATWKYHYEKEILEFRVVSISISCNSKGIWTKKFRICEVKNGKTIDNQRNIEFADYGKTVFLTREEAEKALAERSEGK